MARTTHLNALQALEMAIREGSLQAAASRLGITPAAVGQRIRALEQFLEADLLLRGRSGLQPTPALAGAIVDLHAAFSALDRVTERLDFERIAEIHIVAETDWSDLWLLPRLGRFREEHPNVLFNVNGEGDVPVRLGAADIVIGRDPAGSAATGEPLFSELFAPVGTPEIVERLADPGSHEAPGYLPVGTMRPDRKWRLSQGSIEGFPLLHIKEKRAEPPVPGWRQWIEAFGYRRSAPERGVRYARMRDALEGVRSNAGMLICGLSCVIGEIEAGSLLLPFPGAAHLKADWPYCARIRPEARARPQAARFRDWLMAEAAVTTMRLDATVAA
ncbi:MAG: LysR family transcriptional regulator [Alphaproteobacteria bacterium]|nr:MAG: LysR family transcriptional regulator [Alphaproteobacteria bacterium]